MSNSFITGHPIDSEGDAVDALKQVLTMMFSQRELHEPYNTPEEQESFEDGYQQGLSSAFGMMLVNLPMAQTMAEAFLNATHSEMDHHPRDFLTSMEPIVLGPGMVEGPRCSCVALAAMLSKMFPLGKQGMEEAFCARLLGTAVTQLERNKEWAEKL